MLAPLPAFAATHNNPGETTANEIARTVNAVAPRTGTSKRIAANSASGEISAKSKTLNITIPSTTSDPVILSRTTDGHTQRVGLPSSTNKPKAVVAPDKTVTYASVLPSTDIAIQAFNDSVRIETILRDGKAPTEYTYPVDVPAGGNVTIAPDGGVVIEDANGLPHAGFIAPWAKDATGRDVATHYEIRGLNVVQVVEHAGATYPVVADPWIFGDLIENASWVYYSGPDYPWQAGLGATLKVAPTLWARVFSGSYPVGAAGFDELYSKYRGVKLWDFFSIDMNYNGMRDQFICHQQIVALRDPFKATWNLDTWRPDVGYLETVNTRCNPGGPAIFD